MTETTFRFCDDLGPKTILHIYQPARNLFASAIEPISDYIPGPDMGTNEMAMAWIQDEIGGKGFCHDRRPSRWPVNAYVKQ